MPQCKAITEVGAQCLRNAHPMCGGYCRQHFNRRPPFSKAAITARSKAVKYLVNSGILVGVFVEAVEITQEVIEIAGPFLKMQEIHTLEMMKRPKTKAEFVSNSRSLVRSLSRSPTVPVDGRAVGIARSPKVNLRSR